MKARSFMDQSVRHLPERYKNMYSDDLFRHLYSTFQEMREHREIEDVEDVDPGKYGELIHSFDRKIACGDQKRSRILLH